MPRDLPISTDFYLHRTNQNKRGEKGQAGRDPPVLACPALLRLVNRGGEKEGEKDAVEGEEETAELEGLALDALKPGFDCSNAVPMEVFLPLPELEEEKVAGAFGDFG